MDQSAKEAILRYMRWAVSIFTYLIVCLAVSTGQAADSLTTGQVDAGEVILVKASGPGKLFLGGNLFESPWTLSYDHGRFAVNGFTLRPPPPSPPPSPAQQAEYDFVNAAGALTDSLVRSGLSLATRRQRLADYLRGNSLGYQVEVDSTYIQIRSSEGIRISFHLIVTNVRIDSGPRVSVRDSRAARLKELRSYLESGHDVFIVDRATTIVGQRGRTGEIMAAIARLRQGAVLDSLDLHLLDRSVRGQLLNPLALDNIW